MLSATLESLANQSLQKNRYEVVVVNDGSEDTTPEVCRDFASRIELKYLRIDNSGTSAAKNTGILASRGKVLLFFDDDDIADRRLLEEHLKAHKQHRAENVAVLGYTTWAPTLSVTPLMRYVTDIGRFLFAYGDLKDGQMLDFTYLWAGRSSCKRSFLAKHGVFNRQFRAPGIEDIELGYRLSQFGLRVVFHRAAVSYMARPLTFEAFCVRCERQGEALFLFSRLHDDPVVEQYCRSGDPFIERRTLGANPEVRWPDVASLFREKINQAGRLERLLAWGFEPEELDGADASGDTAHPQAEAYRLQMRELFASLQNSLSQSEQRASRIVELEADLSEREASFQAELRKLKEDIQELSGSLQRTKIESAARASNLAKQTLQIARLERQHKAENAELERQLRAASEQLSQHQVELDHLRDRFLQTNRLLHSRSISLAEHERRVFELTNRLRAQLWSTRKLSHLLEDVDKASARLRSSRRWKLANPLTAIEAKLHPAKVSIGYGHLERIVAKYLQWREAHPEIEKIDDEIIKTLTFPAIPKTSAIEPSKSDDNFDGIPSIAETEIPRSAPETLSIPPPVPAAPVESIRFLAHDEVEVSIIVPVYNQFQFTHACLVSLQMAQERPRFEVILVDDCSTDETADLVPRIEGVVYLRNETNCGFIASCNRGADKARGKYLVFLNNDTIVTERWLTALLDTFTEEPQAGIVGSKLLYPDGRLQEAGGIIWRDASGWNYGKFDDPERPEYNYLREADYCSGAALMIPKALFLSVGGFDSRYAPAYYEDTDLSWRMRLRGWNVLYEPGAVVEHVHSATSGERSVFFTFHADRNRLFMLFKNASPAFLVRSLRSVLSRVATPQGSKTSVDTRDRHPHGRVAASFCLHLPEMLMKRLFIRARRKVSNKEVEGWLYPRAEWDARFV